MRYRRLTADDDYAFGSGPNQFLVNSPAAVAQAVVTRLRLLVGEWFLDLLEGMPWREKVLGKNTAGTYDQAIRDRILGTIGVSRILDYTSDLDRATRKLSVRVTISTIYGEDAVTIQESF